MSGAFCGGCGQQTLTERDADKLSLRPGPNGEPPTWWCTLCLKAKIARARADVGKCHCAQIVGPHYHPAQRSLDEPSTPLRPTEVTDTRGRL